MIGILNEWSLSITVDSIEIKHIEFNSLTLTEKTDNQLPSFALSIRTNRQDLSTHIFKGSIVKILLYKNNKDDYDILSEFIITKTIVKPVEQYNFDIVCYGIFNNLEYLLTPKIYAKRDTLVNCIKDSIKSNTSFKLSKSIDNLSSDDKQSWIQHNIPCREFIERSLKRSYSQNKFFNTAITWDNEFILSDLLYNIQNPVVTTVINSEDSLSEFKIQEIDNIINNTGFLEISLGLGSIINDYSLIEDKLTGTGSDVDLIGNNSFDGGNFGKIIHNEFNSFETHNNYSKSFIYNLTNRLKFSSYSINLFVNQLSSKLKLNDGVTVVIPTETSTSEYYSGKYVVDERTVNITNNNISTIYKCNKNSI